jgi:PAS domain-containing protein
LGYTDRVQSRRGYRPIRQGTAYLPTVEAAVHFIRELQEKGFLRGWEQEFTKKSGEVYVVQLSAQVLNVRGEKVVLSTLVDITERKQAEEALRNLNDELEQRVIQRTRFYTLIAGIKRPLSGIGTGRNCLMKSAGLWSKQAVSDLHG